MDGAKSDHCLLVAYAVEGSEPAFTELVQRHAHAVYASALRQTGNPSLAEEVTQIVFILLARKAASLSADVVVLGWLFRATQFTSKDIMKAERRRLARETSAFEAAAQEAVLNSPSEDRSWEDVSTKLDGCLSQLNENDRNAILLRFFESRSLAEVGSALGVAEDAARKRVRRALDRLHVLLVSAGARIGEGDVEPLLHRHAVTPAPQHVLGLASSAIILPRGVTPKGVDAALGRLARHILWQQWKPWVAAAVVTAVVSSTALLAHHTLARTPVVAENAADDYRVAGFPKSEKVHEFVHRIQGLTGKEDKFALAEAVRYPLQVNSRNGVQIIGSSAQFVQEFEILFAGLPSKVILKCPDHGLYCDSRGIMIGAGEVWIGPDQPGNSDPQPRIIALNLDR